jgi:hypothetical protein
MLIGPGVVGLGSRGYKVCVGPSRIFALVVGACMLTASVAFGEPGHAQAVSSLRVVQAATPRFNVPRYDTSGKYPEVRGGSASLIAVNHALRQAVVNEQRSYAVSARKAVRTGNPNRGVFQTGVVRRLLSASTGVVSALIPLRELYPGGNDGDGWIAVTVRVPSGKRVSLVELFKDPAIALPRLAGVWLGRLTDDERTHCVANYLRFYSPSLTHYRNFALTPNGIAVGFWQAPACERLAAIVPYAAIRGYLSPLGRQLVAAVRPAD